MSVVVKSGPARPEVSRSSPTKISELTKVLFGSSSKPISVRIEEAILATLMAAMAVVTFANVLTRYFSDFSFAFTEEYTVAMMTIMSLLGVSTALRANKHIHMPYFFDQFSPLVRKSLEILFMILAMAVFGILVVYGSVASFNEYRFEEVSPGLGNPAWIYSMWVPIISALIFLRAVLRVISICRSDNSTGR